jgi:hypothetical protein
MNFFSWFLSPSPTIQVIGFEDVLQSLKMPQRFLLINTLSSTEQDCLIQGTLSALVEEQTINELVDNYEMSSRNIILYGKNTSDLPTLERKSGTLSQMGFKVYVYLGGLFEWLLLQDIYSDKVFPTTSNVLDHYKYSPRSVIGIPLLQN